MRNGRCTVKTAADHIGGTERAGLRAHHAMTPVPRRPLRYRQVQVHRHARTSCRDVKHCVVLLENAPSRFKRSTRRGAARNHAVPGNPVCGRFRCTWQGSVRMAWSLAVRIGPQLVLLGAFGRRGAWKRSGTCYRCGVAGGGDGFGNHAPDTSGDPATAVTPRNASHVATGSLRCPRCSPCPAVCGERG